MRLNRFREKAMQGVFFLTAVTSIAAVVIICIFLFCNGVPAMAEIGFFDFVGGQKWAPTNVPASYGIFDMIIASIYVTAGAIIIGVPIGILTAVFLARFCPAPLYKVLKPATELLAGIPSIVYGLFGMLFFVYALNWGYSLLAGAFTLAIMVLPTIMRTTEEALLTVPDSYREGSYGLGSGKLRTIMRIILPSAMPGILAGIILAVGRIVGETAALIYTYGSATGYAAGPLNSGRSLAVHMYVLTNEGLHTDQAWGTAVVLLVLVFAINTLSAFVAKKLGNNKK